MATSELDGQALKAALAGGVAHVSHNVPMINQLNVYPVPDGDTGINMYHTLNRAYQEIEALESENASLVAERFAYGALMGARGNSGTIFSQLLSGFADGLEGAETMTPALLVRACQSAVGRAYAAVSQPTEGTILTVAREAVESLLQGDRDDLALSQLLDLLVAAAQASLENTPQLLPILKEAGVVDAGGMGLLCFLRGMQGNEQSELPVADQTLTGEQRPSALARYAGEDYGYDVQYLMFGEDLDINRIRADLQQMGWSVLVVGNAQAIKVHIHVDNPAIPLDYAIRSGATLDDIVVENMQLQYERIAAKQPASAPTRSNAVSVIAVVEGVGLQAVYRDLNCDCILEGGAGKNPSVETFVSAINGLGCDSLIVLPNDKNIFMAAEQAARLVAKKQVRIVPTETVLQGISAMLAYGDTVDSAADLDEIAAVLSDAGKGVTSIEVTYSTRDTQLHGVDIHKGDAIALIDGNIQVASAEMLAAVREALIQAQANRELATIYYGADISAASAEQVIEYLRKDINDLEFEAVYGGQALYPLLISVE